MGADDEVHNRPTRATVALVPSSVQLKSVQPDALGSATIAGAVAEVPPASISECTTALLLGVHRASARRQGSRELCRCGYTTSAVPLTQAIDGVPTSSPETLSTIACPRGRPSVPTRRARIAAPRPGLDAAGIDLPGSRARGRRAPMTAGASSGADRSDRGRVDESAATSSGAEVWVRSARFGIGDVVVDDHGCR